MFQEYWLAREKKQALFFLCHVYKRNEISNNGIWSVGIRIMQANKESLFLSAPLLEEYVLMIQMWWEVWLLRHFWIRFGHY